MKLATSLLAFGLGLYPRASGQSVITTVAGGSISPINGTSALNAPLGRVLGVAVDTQGNIYVADSGENQIFRINVKGAIQIAAGNGTKGFSGDGGPATSAALDGPAGVAVDATGNLFIADYGNNRIRKVSVNGTITTVAGNGNFGFSEDGGPATSALLAEPQGVALDGSGNLLFSDSYFGRIRKVSANGVITTVAGNGKLGFSGDGGPATSASLFFPVGVAVDSSGSLYIADQFNNRIRKVSVNGVITTVAGNGRSGGNVGDSGGAATATALINPTGVAVDSSGNFFIADGSRIRRVSAGGIITTVAGDGNSGFSGDGGPATSASLYAFGVAVDATGNLFLADFGNARIREVSASGIITTVAGNGANIFSGDGGLATSAALSDPRGVAVDATGNLFIADTGNARIRKVSVNGIITTVAGNGANNFSGDGGPATAASLDGPTGVAVDATGNLFIADYANNRIRKVSVNGTITTVAGNGPNNFSGDGGPATAASLNGPGGVAVDATGNLFIADTYNNRIRKVSVNGTVTTVAGNGDTGSSGDGGPATSASLGPSTQGVAVDAAGNLFIADGSNGRVRRVSTSGIITTVAGNGVQGFSGDGGPATSASLDYPIGVAIDTTGNLFIADFGSNGVNVRVRRVSTSGTITTVAGNGTNGFSGDGGPATSASLENPTGVAMDTAGTLYIADSGNNRVRAVPAVLFPSIIHGGVVPVGSKAPIIQPGEWVSIFGANLADSTATWTGNFPASLGGTSVTINGKAAFLSFVSPTQINLQAPDDTATGPVPVAVTTVSGTATETVTLAQFAPSFLLLDSKHVAGIILRSNGSGAYGGGTYDIVGPTGTSLGYPTVAARAGDAVVLFAVGLGPTNPVITAGKAYSGAAPTINPVAVVINDVKITPAFAGLSSAGLYQINWTVPAGLGTGDVPLQLSVGAVQAQPGVVISLQ